MLASMRVHSQANIIRNKNEIVRLCSARIEGMNSRENAHQCCWTRKEETSPSKNFKFF
jgi:hypothetical protein